MRGNIIMVLMAVIVLCTSIFLVVWISSGAEELVMLISQIEESLPSDTQAAGVALDALNRRWAKDSITWQYMAMHDNMHHISEALVQLTHSYKTGNMEDTLLYCQLLRTAIDTLIDKEQPTLENIL